MLWKTSAEASGTHRYLRALIPSKSVEKSPRANPHCHPRRVEGLTEVSPRQPACSRGVRESQNNDKESQELTKYFGTTVHLCTQDS